MPWIWCSRAVETYGLRAILEYMGLRVNWLPIGRPQHLIVALGDQELAASHVIVCCHGDERGIVLEKLDPEVARDKQFADRLTPDLARCYVRKAGVNRAESFGKPLGFRKTIGSQREVVPRGRGGVERTGRAVDLSGCDDRLAGFVH